MLGVLLLGCPRAPEHPTVPCTSAACTDADGDGVPASEDCDDDDPSRYPGADDAQGDALDHDCSGTDGTPGVELSERADAIWESPAPYSWAGRRLSAGDVDGDGRDELAIAGPGPLDCGFVEYAGPGECASDGKNGRVWVIRWDDQVWSDVAQWTGAGDGLFALTEFVDLDGDADGNGVDDVLLGTPDYAHLFLGPPPWGDLATANQMWDAHHVRHGLVPDDDGDGTASVMLTSSHERGEYLLLHRQWWEGAGGGANGIDLEISGPVWEGLSSAPPAFPDLDGDGRPEWLFGAKDHHGPAGANSGIVYVFPEGQSGVLTVEEAGTSWEGNTAGAKAGFALANAGDVDGDGRQSGLVGAPLDSTWAKSAGRVFVVDGIPEAGAALDDASAVIEGELQYDWLGWRVAGPVDTNDDGFADLVIGAPGDYVNDPALPGKVHLFLGPLDGVHSARDADATWVGSEPGASVGSGLALGDFDGDGTEDLAIGAIRATTPASERGGAVYVLFSVGP